MAKTHGNLALQRRIGESLTFILPDGRTLRISVIDVAAGRVQLLTAAPHDVKILRTELTTPEDQPEKETP